MPDCTKPARPFVPTEFTCELKVVLHSPTKEIYENAARVGRIHGQAENWMPANLNEAVEMIILNAWLPKHLGVEVVGRAEGPTIEPEGMLMI